ncbi:MAG: response regulator transcription factor, partial [Verrucomicrobiota bacterium]
MPKIIEILAVEDNRAYASSLTETIEAAPDMTLVGMFSRGEDSVEALKENSSLLPSIILLDIHLPGRDGISFIPVFRHLRPEAQIIILTQDDNYLKTLEAIRLGVAGYILKKVSIHEIW